MLICLNSKNVGDAKSVAIAVDLSLEYADISNAVDEKVLLMFPGT